MTSKVSYLPLLLPRQEGVDRWTTCRGHPRTTRPHPLCYTSLHQCVPDTDAACLPCSHGVPGPPGKDRMLIWTKFRSIEPCNGIHKMLCKKTEIVIMQTKEKGESWIIYKLHLSGNLSHQSVQILFAQNRNIFNRGVCHKTHNFKILVVVIPRDHSFGMTPTVQYNGWSLQMTNST